MEADTITVVKNVDCKIKLSLKKMQRRERLHSSVEKLLQKKRPNIDDEKSNNYGNIHSCSRQRGIDSLVIKHKGCNPRKITSKEAREFYEFFMRSKHKKKKQKRVMVSQMKSEAPLKECTGKPAQDTVAQQSCLVPLSLQWVDGIAQAVPSTQSFTMPSGFSQVISLPDGTQQSAYLFVVSAAVSVSSADVDSWKSSGNPVINPLIMSQPVALNVTCPPIEKSTADLSVNEKAVDSASTEKSCTQAIGDNSQTSQYTTESEEAKTGSSEVECHSVDHPILETIALEDISLTVQTTDSPMVSTSSEVVVAPESTVNQNANGMNNIDAVQKTQNESVAFKCPEQDVTVLQRPCVKYKASKFCEATTQTGAQEAVTSLANTMVEKAKSEGVLPSVAKNRKEGMTKNAKKQVAERIRRHQCTICHKLFFTNHDLRRHSLTHSNERPFMCDICKKTFRTQNELKLHTPIHSDTTPYQCEYCGKEFRTKGCIKSHIKYHIGDKRHKCMECGRAFVKSADLKRHMAGHRNEKNFKCEECGSAFTRRDNLKAHKLLHTRKGVVTCDLCNKEFINEVYLKRHMHIHKQAKKKPYECQWCPKTYEQLEGLRRHIRQHVGDEKFVCKQCDKKFITSIQLKRHLWLTHEQNSPYRRSIL